MFQCSSASRKFLNTSVTSQHARPVRVSVLFSEPKIPQWREIHNRAGNQPSFSALQRAENSSISISKRSRSFATRVSVLFSEPKIPQSVNANSFDVVNLCVSVLFSEPKIPQSSSASPRRSPARRFSALQRAENSSIAARPRNAAPRPEFQCSSASRKFLNRRPALSSERVRRFQCSSASRKFLNRPGLDPRTSRVLRFSALQRAENSSIPRATCRYRFRNLVSVLFSEPKIPQCTQSGVRRNRCAAFQCSSASRKFLNIEHHLRNRRDPRFQCSSASRKFLNAGGEHQSAKRRRVSVLFSEPKIPQFQRGQRNRSLLQVSVLFSEPKIPQYGLRGVAVRTRNWFQCSSASRKFLNKQRLQRLLADAPRFQCSSASRKFLNMGVRFFRISTRSRFSALQRAENSSMDQADRFPLRALSFSALQRAENSSIGGSAKVAGLSFRFSALQRAENSSIQRCGDAVVVAARGFSALQRAENSSMVSGWMYARNPRPCFSALQRAENSSIDDDGQLVRVSKCFSALQRAENSSISR